jgi:predicted lipoprotein with Yx(FWY)xxD motif
MLRTVGIAKGSALAAVLTALMLATAGSAFADPCADACRSQHNACRMNAKLLYAPRCDSALQACLGGCFAQRPERDRDHERGGRASREFRGPPESRGIPEFRPPRFPGRERR